MAKTSRAFRPLLLSHSAQALKTRAAQPVNSINLGVSAVGTQRGGCEEGQDLLKLHEQRCHDRGSGC